MESIGLRGSSTRSGKGCGREGGAEEDGDIEFGKAKAKGMEKSFDWGKFGELIKCWLEYWYAWREECWAGMSSDVVCRRGKNASPSDPTVPATRADEGAALTRWRAFWFFSWVQGMPFGCEWRAENEVIRDEAKEDDDQLWPQARGEEREQREARTSTYSLLTVGTRGARMNVRDITLRDQRGEEEDSISMAPIRLSARKTDRLPFS
jgi:hypothetical protein